VAGRKDVVIRAQALDGVWDVLGAGAARGVFPEDVVLEVDPWGPSKASFNLRRNPARPWPDLGAFTPVEIEVGGMTVWDGRVLDTPSRVAERIISVQPEGWQYHLDDDVYPRGYVHNDLAAWKDIRSHPSGALGANRAAAAFQTNASDGMIVITYPSAVAATAGAYGAVFLDLGPGSLAAGLSADYETSNNSSASTFVCRGDAPDLNGPANDLANSTLTTLGASGTFRGAFPTPSRYIVMFMQHPGAVTPAADYWVRIKRVQVFTNDAWRSADVSILKASDVALDALATATMLLSADRSGIQATSFNIPTFWPDEPVTPRQAWERADAYHSWVKQIAVGRRPIYKPQPSAPRIEVGNWSAATDEDASANSGEEIYNRAFITGQTPDGQAVRAKRGSIGTFDSAAPVQLSNPSFDVNTTGWSNFIGTGVIARDTGVFDTSPASLRATSDAIIGTATPATSSWATPVEPGAAYRIFARIRRQAACTDFIFNVNTYFSDHHGIADLPAGQFANYLSPIITPDFSRQLTPQLLFQFFGPINTILAYIDTVIIYQTKPTIVDRRGFRRTKTLPVSNTLPSDLVAAYSIGDTWLPDHKTTPFKGTVSITGNGAARDILTGEDLPPERLLLMGGELILFNDRPDPDTGGHGRVGRIVGVKYVAAEDRAEVTIDNSRQSFEALLARYGVLAGGG
jgi:hypothetical protein